MTVDGAELRGADSRERLELFAGDSGGIDSWLTSGFSDIVYSRLNDLPAHPLSCSQLNQLLALSHQAGVSEAFFRYYWLSAPKHPYDVTRIPFYHPTFNEVDQILSLDQLYWGLYRIYVDSLLFFGSIRNGYRALRDLENSQLHEHFQGMLYPTDAMLHRGQALPLEPISRDDRYLIAEQACKSFDAPPGNGSELLMVLKGAWAEHVEAGGGRVTAKQLLEGAYVLNGFKEKQRQLIFAADEILESEVESEDQLIEKYEGVAHSFARARGCALRNTELYLSMANDLDVYVATSMRTREQFRDMAQICEAIFSHPAVAHLNLRYFDPTLSAARGHEDKGLIECLMVKCAKVLIYVAGDRDSYGKDVEAAMALSLGKPVIFLCAEQDRLRFFNDVHPLSRLIDFDTGVAVGGMATSSVANVSMLLGRIFENDMEYALEQPRRGCFRLKERLTGSTVRLQTGDTLLRETF
ncbi:MAG TPA: hypothetical protein VEU62_04065 [Bryobacterales bacterium]|nr:hypothetical protein [Bryobacterales bacterium]